MCVCVWLHEGLEVLHIFCWMIFFYLYWDILWPFDAISVWKGILFYIDLVFESVWFLYSVWYWIVTQIHKVIEHNQAQKISSSSDESKLIYCVINFRIIAFLPLFRKVGTTKITNLKIVLWNLPYWLEMAY